MKERRLPQKQIESEVVTPAGKVIPRISLLRAIRDNCNHAIDHLRHNHSLPQRLVASTVGLLALTGLACVLSQPAEANSQDFHDPLNHDLPPATEPCLDLGDLPITTDCFGFPDCPDTPLCQTESRPRFVHITDSLPMASRETIEEPCMIRFLVLVTPQKLAEIPVFDGTQEKFISRHFGPVNTALENTGTSPCRVEPAGFRVVIGLDDADITTIADQYAILADMYWRRSPFDKLENWLAETTADVAVVFIAENYGETMYLGLTSLLTPDTMSDHYLAAHRANIIVRDMPRSSYMTIVLPHEFGHLAGGNHSQEDVIKYNGFPESAGYQQTIGTVSINTIMAVLDTSAEIWLQPLVYSHPGTLEIDGTVYPVGDKEHNLGGLMIHTLPFVSQHSEYWRPVYHVFLPILLRSVN